MGLLRKRRETRILSSEEFRRELDRRIAEVAVKFHIQSEHAGAFKTLLSTLATLYYLEGSLKSHVNHSKSTTRETFQDLHDVVDSMLLPLLQTMREHCGQFVPGAEFADEIEALKRFCGARLYPL